MNSNTSPNSTTPCPQNKRRIIFDCLQTDLNYLYNISESIEQVASYMVSQSSASDKNMYEESVTASTAFPDYALALPKCSSILTDPTNERKFLRSTDFPPDVLIPPVQCHCGKRHWQGLMKWCQDLRQQLQAGALGDLKYLKKNAPAMEWEKFHAGAIDKAPRLLERLLNHIRSTSKLVDVGATLCAVMSDFGYSSDGRPSLMLSRTSLSLRRCHLNLEEAIEFLREQVTKSPEVSITRHEEEAFHLLRDLFASKGPSTSITLKLPVLAALIGLSDDQTRTLARSKRLIAKVQTSVGANGTKQKTEQPTFTIAQARQLARAYWKSKKP